MPYKDKKKRLESNRRWKAKNKEKVAEYQKEYQKEYQEKYNQTIYLPVINDMQKFSYEDQIQYLLKLLGPKRQAILRRMDNMKMKQDVQKRIKQKQEELKNERINLKWGYVKKWMTDRGCDCGEKSITKLTFHHLDPSKKKNTIRKMCQGNSMKKILAELKKGVVKCKNCHTIIHAGTSKEREDILINQYLKASMKDKSGYKNKLLIWTYKKTLSCVKCEINDPVILLFHHIDSKLKSEKISRIYYNGRDIINKELKKTICLCQNCHEDFHSRYGTKTIQSQLEEFLGKKVIPLKVDIKDYLPTIDQNISKFYNLSFLIT